MNIPKYIDKALEKRRKAAETLAYYDSVVTDFIIDNNIEVENYDYNTGCEMYANPYASEERIREAIKKA